MDLTKLFRTGKAAPTADDLRAAIAELEAESEARARTIDELRERRAEALISASDAEVDRIEAELAAQTRALDRADAAHAALRQRLAEAEAAERQGRLDALHRDALERQQQAVAALRKEYPAAVRRLIALAERVQAADAAISEANAALQRAGDPRQVEPVDAAARPKARDGGLLVQPVFDLVRLPMLDDAEQLAWPRMSIFGVRREVPRLDFRHVPTSGENPNANVPPPQALPDNAPSYAYARSGGPPRRGRRND